MLEASGDPLARGILPRITGAVLAPPSNPSPTRRTPAPARAPAASGPRRWGTHLPILATLGLALALNTAALRQNGYANTYYAAAIRSMLSSWHHLFFLSADPGGLIAVDKPPLALWLQAASARIFGFTPLSLLLPQAIAGVGAVGALYRIVGRRLGRAAGLAGAMTLAVFPSFVAVARDSTPDPLLILLMILACGAALRAVESGTWRPLLWSALLVGLAFNTKALAAYLIVPGIAAAYLRGAPGPLRQRITRLAGAGVVLAVVSLAWMLAVDLTPASKRPFVGGSTDNSEFGLTFKYNGVGRLEGQLGGPGPVPQFAIGPAATDPGPTSATPGVAFEPRPRRALSVPGVTPAFAQTSTATPLAFGPSAGPLRLLGRGLGDQGAWLLPFALVGLLAAAVTRQRTRRSDIVLVFGGFLLVEAGVLSFSSGIVHPYYVSALGPAIAAGVAIGLVSLGDLTGRWRRLLPIAALALSVAVQVLLLSRGHYLLAWRVALTALGLVAAVVLWRRDAWLRWVLPVALALLLVVPTAYSLTLWQRPGEGTFPAAGPRAVGGYGGAGVSRVDLATDRALTDYVLAHEPGSHFELLTEASLTAAAPILLGLKASAMGGYGGSDPALDGAGLARLVARGEARYVLIGGSYAYRGGNRASRAAEQACPLVPAAVWHASHPEDASGLYLLDCQGQAARLKTAS